MTDFSATGGMTAIVVAAFLLISTRVVVGLKSDMKETRAREKLKGRVRK